MSSIFSPIFYVYIPTVVRWIFVIQITLAFSIFQPKTLSIGLLCKTFDKLVFTFLISLFPFNEVFLFLYDFVFVSFFSLSVKHPFCFSFFLCFYIYRQYIFIQKNVPKSIACCSRILCKNWFLNDDSIFFFNVIIFCQIQ